MPGEEILNVQTTLTNNPGNDISPEMKTYYDKNLIRFASPKLVHAQFGQKRNIPKGSGKTIEFRRFSPLPKALVPLTEGVTPKGNQLNVTAVTAEVSQYGDYITSSDMLELTAIDNTILETQRVLGDQAGRTLDTVIRERINAGTNVQYGAGKEDRSVLVGGEATYSANDYLNVETVKKAVATLKRNNASPIKDGCYVAIVHPDVANDLTNDPEWKAVKQNVDPKDWYNGVIGKIHGVVFVESTEAKVFAPGNLTSGAKDLTVKSVAGNVITVNEEITFSDVEGLNGTKVQIEEKEYTVISVQPAEAGSATITVAEKPGEEVTSSVTISAAGGTSAGRNVYSTLFIGQNAYGVTNIEDGGLQTIIKQKGSAGTGDPLNQRSTVGWKATQTAEILSNEFMVRVETTCSFQ